ncbi:MAG TPA: MFS transporter, partial [Acidimicrobiales bacterium]
ADLVRAVLFAICCLDVPVGVLLAAVALASLATPAFASARSALLPDAAAERYPEAVKLTTATNQVSLALGALAGGALLAWLGPEGALGANSVSFVVSAMFLTRLTVGRQPSRVGTTIGKHLAGTWELLRTDPFLRGAATVAAGASAGLMAAEALAAAVGLDASGAGAAGVFAAAVPVGTIVGALICPRPADHRHALALAGLLCVIGGGVAAGLFVISTGWMLAIPFAFIGLAFALVIPTQVIVGDRLVGEYRATGFAVLTGFLLGAQAVGAALGGVIASVTGLRAVCVGGAAVAALFGIFTMIRWRPHHPVVASATTPS